MKNQLQHWNHAHEQHWLSAHSQKQTAFAEEVNRQLHPHAKMLELGCGEGNDSLYFAKEGHTVIATDFSDVVIAENNKRLTHPSLSFRIQDISQPLEFNDGHFDAVYARLSLHYFTDEVTVRIFREIVRVLIPGGHLFFMCKEVSDPIYGKGEKIEDDMFELDGHVRHFFSEPYVRKLLDMSGLQLQSLEASHELIYDRHSAFIKAVATKPA
ncbi:MAG TPA: class I SAM-dependent methyltransferase [Candidatus Saccharimonadales bacterium]|nr:class I SAM-dependent methyltransferase [Candidatus Saccharimonadales bacterium]